MSKIKREPADAGQSPRLAVTIDPYSGHSIVTVVISTRSGRERLDHRLARWHIPLTRADLAGHSTDDVLITVLGMVMQRVELRRADPADWRATRRPGHSAVGPGAPLGATGGTVTEPPLPGL